MNDATATLVTKLRKSARNLQSATNTNQREAARGYLIQRAGELHLACDALERTLHKRWDWLGANDGEERPDTFERREERTIALLHDYEAMQDALRDAMTVLTGQQEVA